MMNTEAKKTIIRGIMHDTFYALGEAIGTRQKIEEYYNVFKKEGIDYKNLSTFKNILKECIRDEYALYTKDSFKILEYLIERINVLLEEILPQEEEIDKKALRDELLSMF